jgi:hypothetical protein
MQSFYNQIKLRYLSLKLKLDVQQKKTEIEKLAKVQFKVFNPIDRVLTPKERLLFFFTLENTLLFCLGC